MPGDTKGRDRGAWYDPPPRGQFALPVWIIALICAKVSTPQPVGAVYPVLLSALLVCSSCFPWVCWGSCPCSCLLWVRVQVF